MVLERFLVTDKVAVVTGAGRGIGAGAAVALAEAGADVVCAARTLDQIEKTVADVEAHGRRGVAVVCDVNKREDLEGLVSTTVTELGRIDILVNNAGGWMPAAALQQDDRDFQAAFRFNVVSALTLTQLVVPRMVQTAGAGAVVNISSRAGSMVQPAFAAYGTVKAALSYLTRLLASEFAPKVRVNAIEAGAVATSALDIVMTNDELRTSMENRTPMRRIGTVEDVAACVLYLASDASSYVTGKVLQVDGGTEHPILEIPTPPL